MLTLDSNSCRIACIIFPLASVQCQHTALDSHSCHNAYIGHLLMSQCFHRTPTNVTMFPSDTYSCHNGSVGHLLMSQCSYRTPTYVTMFTSDTYSCHNVYIKHLLMSQCLYRTPTHVTMLTSDFPLTAHDNACIRPTVVSPRPTHVKKPSGIGAATYLTSRPRSIQLVC